MAKSPWRILGIPAGSDRDAIRRAYARLLKQTNPEDDPDGFMALRAAYETALRMAEWQQYEDAEDEEAETAADDDADDAADDAGAPPVPEAPPAAPDPDAAEVEALIARQQALVDLLQAGAAREPLLAAADAVLAAPLAGRIDVRARLEEWLAAMLVQFQPASDPLVVPLIDRFGWDAPVGRPPHWHVAAVLQRRDEGAFINAIGRPFAPLHQGFTALTASGQPGWRRRLTALSAAVAGEVRQILGSIDAGLPGAADWLDADAMAWWRQRLARPALSWDALLLAPLLLLGLAIVTVVAMLSAEGDTLAFESGFALLVPSALAVLLLPAALAAPWAAVRWLLPRQQLWQEQPWTRPHWLAWWPAAQMLLVPLAAAMAVLPGWCQGPALFGLFLAQLAVLAVLTMAVPALPGGVPARLWGVVRSAWPLAVLGAAGLALLPVAQGTAFLLLVLGFAICWWRASDEFCAWLVALLPHWQRPGLFLAVLGLALLAMAMVAGPGFLLAPVAGLYLDKLGALAAAILLFAAFRIGPQGWWRAPLLLAWLAVLAVHVLALERVDGGRPASRRPVAEQVVPPLVVPATTPPRPLNNTDDWVRAADVANVGWPAAGGRFATEISLAVAADGRVAGCVVEKPSGLPALDKASCAAMERRARLAPAQDADGKPVAGFYRLRQSWQVPPKGKASPARPPLQPVACEADDRPPGPAPLSPCARKAWLTGDDYPPDALAAGQQGRVGFTLLVDARGVVTGCEINASSGGPLLDKGTCRLLQVRARFLPERGPDGAPRASEYADSIRWKISN